ncbi:DUF3320 domain-containing protein [Paenibacillus sp. 1001270B_150601_E10]|uniref:DUF3320 domain-containing protein n=1 Tax=Paenibacillus sp. 1001270B_150601_E10 TaxID=2787079 RepID=UPI00189D4D9F|nr:DUF3320 domain-containing protein [Paenibacillus sp. 1001270B_150601_E10]
MESRISCEWLYSETINYAMQQNQVPVIKSIVLTNTTDKDMNGITLKFESEPQFAYEWNKKLDVLPAGQSIDIGTVDLQMSTSFLGELSERLIGSLTLTVWENDTELLQQRGSISVLAYDEWSGLAILPEMTAAFVTPNHRHVTEVIREAGAILEQWSGSPSFTAYQSKDPNRVRVQAAAIYSALHNREISYCVAPPSFEQIGQRVRLPESIFTHRLGNCLDLSMLYAACLEAAGLHPLIIFTEGHAFAGVWLVEETFSETVQDDISVLTKRLAAGINEICVVESTAFVKGDSITFDQAAMLAEEYLRDSDLFDCLIDIRRARAAAIRPLPLRSKTTNGWVIEEIHETKENRNAAPEPLEVLERPLEVESLKPATRQQQWERKLLDLTLRNSLLNFRLTKSSIPVISAQLGDLEDALADGDEFQLLARPSDWEDNGRNPDLYQSVNVNHPLVKLLQEEFVRRRLRADLNAQDLEKRMVHIYRSARTALEENGANTLFLALGLLKWYESPVSELPRYAPIVLIPVDILRKSSRQGYVIRARDEEPQINITLFEMLRQDFGIGIDGLDPLPRDEKGIALKQIFNVIRHALIQVSRWDIEETAYLGLFSFGQFVMWNDIRTRADKLAENQVVASLMQGQLLLQESVESSTKSLDEEHPAHCLIPISADSSQLSAIHAAIKGQSFVLHGPPGTGKSQTITNMIASALANGKKVLFVAEKMAALSVVQRRLEQIGLGPFCLELHSNKSTKRAVLDQLNHAIEVQRVQTNESWERQADRLHQLRSALNDYVEALHRKHTFGFNLFEVISDYEAAGQAPDVVHFDDAAIEGLDPDAVIKWNDTVAELIAAGANCGNLVSHPWMDSKLLSYTQDLKAKAEVLLKSYISELERRKTAMDKAVKQFKLGAVPLTLDKVTILVQLCELANCVPDIKPALMQAANIAESIEKLKATALQGKCRDQARAKVTEFFTAEALRLDAQMTLSAWDSLELKWFLPKWTGQNRIFNLLKKMAVPDQVIAKEEVRTHLMNIISLQEEEQKLIQAKEEAAPFVGSTLIWGDEGDWDEIINACEWLNTLHTVLTAWFTSTSDAHHARTQIAEFLVDLRKNAGLRTDLQALLASHDQVQHQEKELRDLLQFDFERIAYQSQGADWHVYLLKKANGWVSHLDLMRDWSTWQRVRLQAEEQGLLPLIIPYEEGSLSNDQLKDAFKRGLYKKMANYIIARDERLMSFSGSVFEETLLRFKEADEEYMRLTQQEIVARLSARVPQMTQEASQSSEAGILQRAIRSGGRNMSIRKLFEQLPNLLPRLVPCMLMSPISVAQYLDPERSPFDIVIFDEASQVPTAQAVGALARGSQSIIVGDPKQLPPTSFFSKNRQETEEEEPALQDMESILDDCLALGMPGRHLTWHYRSRHESLIAFSNAHYYENKLMTFPSPDEPVSSVRWCPVEGFYDRGRTKQNRAEGEAVVAEIIRRIKDPVLRQQSMGVVTFSSIQQTLIEDLLEEVLKQEPEVEMLIMNLPEPLFIKNLENVQGDERDVILFSVGYGPDATGKVSLNFGPLNRQGGWRRLNVAVSRARYEMLVFSTLHAHHLNASRISSEGVLGLKAFLEYAEKGKRILPAGDVSSQVLLASHIHRSLAAELNIRGYHADLNVGSSGYRIDVGVLDPESDQYVLGILLDGLMYQQAESARDRNILREEVLKQLGWNLMRVWSPDWWDNREGVMNRIVEAIERGREVKKLRDQSQAEVAVAREQTTIKRTQISTVRSEHHVQPIQVETSNERQTYHICVLDSVPLGADFFHSSESTGLIVGQIRKVIQEEGPISRSLLAKRILQAWGITRLGARLDQRFTELLMKIQPEHTEAEGMQFFWPEGVKPSEYSIYRIPADETQRRMGEDLPPEEVGVVVKSILSSQISLPYDELMKQVAKTLGYSRLGSALEKATRLGVLKAIELGYVYEDENQRVVIL